MKTTFFIALLLLLNTPIWSNINSTIEEDRGFSYQAVARNSDGEILSSENIQLRFSLHPGPYSTTPDWQETHTTTTDEFGVFSLTIGKGIKENSTVETFSDLDFAAFEYWLKVEVRESSAWAEISFSALQSVPYAEAAGNGILAGMIVPFAGTAENVPEGWALCNGTSLSRTAYSSLFNAIGTSWGYGDGSTTFNLPDLRGLFLRGVDAGRGQDNDRNSRTSMRTGGNRGDQVGSYQNDEFERHRHSGSTNTAGNHSHDVYGHIGNREPSLDAGRETGDRNNARNRYKTSSNGNHTHSFNTNNTGGNETRPKNAYVNYIIKL